VFVCACVLECMPTIIMIVGLSGACVRVCMVHVVCAFVHLADPSAPLTRTHGFLAHIFITYNLVCTFLKYIATHYMYNLKVYRCAQCTS